MLSRRNFLRGGLGIQGSPLRPPWSLSEDHFVDTCTRCDACRRACPESIIVSDSGYPTIDFHRGECTFCGECVTACDTGALDRQPGNTPWHYRASIRIECLALHGVVCQSCRDACEPNAIAFRHRSTLVAEPVIDPESCNGCGACVSSCPAAAITIKAPAETHLARKELA